MFAIMFQIVMRVFPDFIIFMLSILAISEIFALKIGLLITKAQDKKNLKWVMISFAIQVGIFFFIASPLILMGMTGSFQQGGPDPMLIALFILLALFVDLNILNVLHKLGFKRALLVFGIMMIPFIIIVVIISSVMTMASQVVNQ